MAEDTGWLKKNPVGNPFKMSIRRSSRFYAQDMDGSIMTNEDKDKNQVLVVSHMPRKSNIPIEKIKQMDFKIPAPVYKKSGIKKPVSRMSKFTLDQNFSRPSSHFRHSPRKNGTEFQNQNSKNTKVGSKVGRPSSVNGCLLSVPKHKVANRASMIPESCSQLSMPSSADLSILSRSKIVNQSTPNDAAQLRTILKQNKGFGNRCTPGKKSKAAKRVNFNCVETEESNQKRNKEILPKPKGSVLLVDFETNVKDEPLCESDEDSTVAFSTSFKPITYEETRSRDDERVVEDEVESEKEENVVEDEIESEKEENVVDDEVEPLKENNDASVENKHVEVSVSNRVIGNIINMWSVYRKRLNKIWNQLQVNDECFQNNLQLISENGLQEKFSVYETEKCKLYDELKCLEEEFRNEIKKKIDTKTLFLRYLEKKLNIYKAKSELEENFEKTLSALTDGHLRNDEEIEKREENSGKKTPKKSVTTKRLSEGKGKSGRLSSSLLKIRPAKHKMSSPSSTPESTPARRRKLSRKIEDQIRTLFEE